MKPLCIGLVAATFVGVALAAGAPPVVTASDVIPDEQAAHAVVVADVRTGRSTVTGLLVNRTEDTVREVRLQIDHTWLWKDERHPGEDNPGRTDFYTLSQDIPPAGSAPFTIAMPPLPERTDGHFLSSVRVVGFTQVGKAPSGSLAPE